MPAFCGETEVPEVTVENIEKLEERQGERQATLWKCNAVRLGNFSPVAVE